MTLKLENISRTVYRSYKKITNEENPEIETFFRFSTPDDTSYYVEIYTDGTAEYTAIKQCSVSQSEDFDNSIQLLERLEKFLDHEQIEVVKKEVELNGRISP